MRILVLAPLRAGVDYATDDAWLAPVRFEPATFDEVMAKVGPALVLDEPGQARIERRFASLRAFDDTGPAPAKAASLIDDILSANEDTSTEKHSQIKALERAWRGLAFLVSKATPKGVEIHALDAAHDDVDEVLEKITRAGAMFDLVIVDHVIEASARDLDRLVRWAERGEGLGAPLICGGTPALLGQDDLAALARSERRLRSSDDPRAVRFRSIAARDPMRWVAITLNGAPMTGAPYIVGALAIESFARTGWPTDLTRAAVSGITLAATPTTEVAREAAAAGMILLVPDGSGARALAAPVVHRPASTGGGTSPAAALGLGDQLFFAHLWPTIQQLAAAIPSTTPPDVARATALVALNELFSETLGSKPSFDVSVGGMPPALEVTVRPRGFAGVAIEEATLGAALG